VCECVCLCLCVSVCGCACVSGFVGSWVCVARPPRDCLDKYDRLSPDVKARQHHVTMRFCDSGFESLQDGPSLRHELEMFIHGSDLGSCGLENLSPWVINRVMCPIVIVTKGFTHHGFHNANRQYWPRTTKWTHSHHCFDWWVRTLYAFARVESTHHP
jgi:hypothetical protein